MSEIESIDLKNDEFWSEPCGTNAMVLLGLDPESPHDVKKFDDWYFKTYPYLLEYLDGMDLKNAHVLEVGIGLGTVSRYLARRAKTLTCLDIAHGAISYVKSTTKTDTNINYVCQSILNYQPLERFDIVIAVGSLHHTGDLESALSRVEKLLKNKGTILIMVYNAFQIRRFVLHPFRTTMEFLQTFSRQPNRRLIFEELDEGLRARADANLSGEAAPYTAFSSKKLFMDRSSVIYNFRLQNFHRIPFFGRFINREFTLEYFSKNWGCDIYALGVKNSDDSL